MVDLEIRKWSGRVRVLQNNLNRLLGLIEARAVMYGGQLGEYLWPLAYWISSTLDGVDLPQ